MTIKDIAKEANVSITTVSLVLNGKCGRLSKETIDNILDIAKKNNYQPNQMAVGLVTKKTKTIGLIVPDIQNTFFGEAAKWIEYEVSKEGYNVILCNTNGKAEEDLKYIELLKGRGVDGLIISFSADSTEKEEQDHIISVLNNLKIPFISLDRWIEGLKCPRVSIDHRKGGYLATRYLIEKGHSRIACIMGPKNVYTARRRLAGYQEALAESNISFDPELVFEGDYRFDGGYEGGKYLLDKDITAVFVSNDMMCYGFYKAVRERNIRIPEDISVIGFDDLFFSGMLEVPLTTIRQPVDVIAVEACRVLLEQMNGIFNPESTKIEPRLIERKSVKAI